MAAGKVAKTGWRYAFSRWAYNKSYFNQLGLMIDDTLDETPDVQEAIRRLPQNVYDDRVFRITRALNLSNRKDVLPKEEWMRFEEDYRYLQPYLQEVTKERKEREAWNRQ